LGKRIDRPPAVERNNFARRIRDHDGIYSDRVDRTIAAMGLTVLKTPARSPQANAFCERLIGTIRRATPKSYLQADGDVAAGSFSPDCRWVAYDSNESGAFEIYVQSLPVRRGKWRISTGGGSLPRWREDGKEIFFRHGAGLMAAAVTTSPDHSRAGMGFLNPDSSRDRRVVCPPGGHPIYNRRASQYPWPSPQARGSAPTKC
jgi:hypothetical protein